MHLHFCPKKMFVEQLPAGTCHSNEKEAVESEADEARFCLDRHHLVSRRVVQAVSANELSEENMSILAWFTDVHLCISPKLCIVCKWNSKATLAPPVISCPFNRIPYNIVGSLDSFIGYNWCVKEESQTQSILIKNITMVTMLGRFVRMVNWCQTFVLCFYLFKLKATLISFLWVMAPTVLDSNAFKCCIEIDVVRLSLKNALHGQAWEESK